MLFAGKEAGYVTSCPQGIEKRAKKRPRGLPWKKSCREKELLKKRGKGKLSVRVGNCTSLIVVQMGLPKQRKAEEQRAQRKKRDVLRHKVRCDVSEVRVDEDL
jgi:hypothetical protein